MGLEERTVQGRIRYGVLDTSIGPEERALYSTPAYKHVKDEWQQLHDFRTSTNVTRGPEGLDVQGFTYVNHASSLSGDDLLKDRNVEEFYLKEVTDLICRVTGATSAIVDGVAFRQKEPNEQNDPYFYSKRGSDFDIALSKMRRDVVRVPGREQSTSAEPARIAHIDYSVDGLRNCARNCREDIAKVAAKHLEAEDRVEKGDSVLVPRYAAYSVWRPLDTVKRDPIAVLDRRTTNDADLVLWKGRVLSALTDTGETYRESHVMTPPSNPESLRWYWMPDQQPDEVLIIKFADTGARNGIATGCVHCSPEIPGAENEPPRRSVECRVFAFWD